MGLSKLSAKKCEKTMERVSQDRNSSRQFSFRFRTKSCMFHRRQLRFQNLENHLAKRLFHPKEVSKPPLHTQKPESESAS